MESFSHLELPWNFSVDISKIKAHWRNRGTETAWRTGVVMTKIAQELGSAYSSLLDTIADKRDLPSTTHRMEVCNFGIAGNRKRP